MSSGGSATTTTPPATPSDLWSEIQTDIANAWNVAEADVLAVASETWSLLEIAFELVTSEQARVILDVFNKVQSDITAGDSLEEIETDMLNTASAEELAILTSAGSEIVQGFIAFIQAAQSAKLAIAKKKSGTLTFHPKR